MKDVRERPISFSQLDTFRQCPLKHFLAYREGYRPHEESEKFQLGTLWHKMLEVHYAVIKEWQEANGWIGKMRYSPIAEAEILTRCAAAVGLVLSKVKEDAHRELLRWVYDGYVEQYGADPQWRILAVELRGQVPLAEDRRPLVWIIDLVVEDIERGGVWIIDHKLPGQFASDTEIELDEQLGLYWLGLTLDPAWQDIAQLINGAMLNEAKKKQNQGDKPGATKGAAQLLEKRFRRTPTDRTVRELEAIRRDALAAMDAMDAGIVYSSPNPKECGWKCDFTDAHVISRRSGRPIGKVLGQMGFTTFEERAAQRESA